MASTEQSSPPQQPHQHLPKDIIVDILTRLPVRSVLRFKSVSKSWYALLISPNFTTKHFHTTKHSTPHPTFLFTTANKSITLLSTNAEPSLNIPINLDIPFLHVSKPLRVTGSCDGFVCLSVLPRGSIILIWNPATREVKDLPVSPIKRPQAGPIKVVLGFGFNFNSNDYKVLRIVYYGYPLSQVEMYSLKTNKWKEIKTDVGFLIFESGCTVVLNGRFHWTALAFREMNGRKVIVSFDMGEENFLYIMPPRFEFSGSDDDGSCSDDDEDDDDAKLTWSVVALKERLAVIGCRDARGQSSKIGVWVMDEYGVAGSWRKYMSFGPYERINRPLGCGKNGEVLLEKNHDELVLYDAGSHTIKNLGTGGVPGWSEVFNHEESLLSIKGGKVAEGSSLRDVIPDSFFVRRSDLMEE
ncbi:unnamed protein product [Ilex paraguariensis]|uniref:F-box domain-containing protein n=1 Tax=Ilex paraguariensis TaxID=185542 RepID=A0ABC8TG21_9AQUA